MRLLCFSVFLAATVSAQKLPFTVDAMMKVGRIGEPLLSPDGKTIAFTLERPDIEATRRPKQIYTVPTAGGTPFKSLKKELRITGRVGLGQPATYLYFRPHRFTAGLEHEA
ncbi:MAG: hypothetical protein WKF37_04380 [Bryobacteraceae bacterium]